MARPILVAAVAALALGLAPAAAQAASTTDSRDVSVSGSVFDPVSNEIVDLAGQMQVVTTLSGSAAAGWTVDLKAALHDTVGTGRSSSARYVATGTDTGTAQMPPGPPNMAVFQTSFALIPPGPPARTALPMSVTVNYNVDGSVASVQAQLSSST